MSHKVVMKELNRFCIPRRNSTIKVPWKWAKGIGKGKACLSRTEGVGLGVKILWLPGKETAKKEEGCILSCFGCRMLGYGFVSHS